jgi:hypothetical protein
LAASALALPAKAAANNPHFGLYGHGMVWNPTLPGVAGEVKLAFELWLNLEASNGIGIAEDPLHPDWEFHFAISSVIQQKGPNGLTIFRMQGVITRASVETNAGVQIRIYAETDGEATGIGIALGDDLGFGGVGFITLPRFRIDPASLSTGTIFFPER